MSESHLRVNAPQVIHETIDDEVIIINLATGNYYSVKGSGADVWDVIQQSPGLTEHEVVAVVASRFGKAATEVDEHVASFLGDLRTEGLLADDAEPATVSTTGAANDGGEFEKPVLEKFSDMQDLVLLDPVHEVDATGWPQPLPETPATGSAA